jgi:hypothetical protein
MGGQGNTGIGVGVRGDADQGFADILIERQAETEETRAEEGELEVETGEMQVETGETQEGTDLVIEM